MINIHPLYSSSFGNMFHLETKRANLLIDVGVSYKAVNEGLNSINKKIDDITGILITHEHTDHIKGLSLLCRKNDIPIYACGKTATYIEGMLKEKNIPANIFEMNYGQPFKIKDMEITPFETSHDAICPCGFRIKNDESILSYATDLGYVSNEVFEYLKESNYTVLEANYDTTMLQFGKYPYPLKRRIDSNIGHLSNLDSSNTIVNLINNGKNRFLFAHLSENNNNKDILQDTLLNSFVENDINPLDIEFNFASKTLSCEEYIL